MRLTPSDPDIETLLRRIEEHTVDLQPNFQRGEVWGPIKQKRLIDTIFRNWYVPPIHVIEHKPSAPLEVLDGQQRLAAIRDYAMGRFPFDGKLEPISEELARLDGLYYSSLPKEIRARFLRFPIRLYTIHDFEPGEPAELFFRLNQQVSLTAAEQRNAFFGPVRDQIRGLARRLEEPPLGGDTLGFGNSRMSYDDAIARVALTLEQGTLQKRVTAALLSARYRSKHPFPKNVIHSVASALDHLSQLISSSYIEWRFNKPILHSWLVFLANIGDVSTDAKRNVLLKMADLYHEVETNKNRDNLTELFDGSSRKPGTFANSKFIYDCAAIYRDRATSRVSDVSSVVYRDIYLWLLLYVSAKSKDSDHLFEVRQFKILAKASNEFGIDQLGSIFISLEMLYDWGDFS